MIMRSSLCNRPYIAGPWPSNPTLHAGNKSDGRSEAVSIDTRRLSDCLEDAAEYVPPPRLLSRPGTRRVLARVH